jgi:hypothetical protein
MKWPWAVILSAAALLGCRGSQPATNPFLRTTVPPPATGQGMMVMPGEPVPAGVTPPVVTGVPGAASATPVVPAQPAPMVAPPITPPPEEAHPPGGSYLFHQSSREGPRSPPSAGEVEGAVATSPPRDLGGATPEAEVRQASHVQVAVGPPATASESTLTMRAVAGPASGQSAPPDRVAAVTVGQAGQANQLRIVGQSAAGAPAAASSPTKTPGESVFRLRVSPATGTAAATTTVPIPAGQGSSVAFVTPAGATSASAQPSTPAPSR